MKKLTELAKEIDLDPEELYRELVERGLDIVAVDRELDTPSSNAILALCQVCYSNIKLINIIVRVYM